MPAKRHNRSGSTSAIRSGSLEATAIKENKRTREILDEIKQDEVMPAVQTDGTEVEVTLGINENLGDFNHAKVFVSVRLPCQRGNVEQAADEAYALTDAKLNEFRGRFLAQ
jgi:hypothetical protein